jgi:pyruvate formate lyase activating enzyme
MKRGRYFLEKSDGNVQCRLCPRNCVIPPGEKGFCAVRANRSGKGVCLNYGSLSAIHMDPMEKKPLYHFKPGQEILSLGSYGCNLSCDFCQNHSIAQEEEQFLLAQEGKEITPAMILDKLDMNLAGIAYTYNEPVVWFEFMADCASLLKEKGYSNVMVTNGYIEPEPLRELFTLIDAFSVDLKGYSEEFYRNISGGRLKPVQRNLEEIAQSGCHLEVDYLVIPGLNDGEAPFEELLKWYAGELGPQVPLHINRYFPQFKMEIPATPSETLKHLYEISQDYLDYVYIGNADLDVGQDTLCPSCGNVLIERKGYHIEVLGEDSLYGDPVCPYCGHLEDIIY